MNKLKYALLGGLALAGAALTASSAGAQTNQIGRTPNFRQWGYSETLLATTSASTTPVAVLSVANSPVNDPNAYDIQGNLGGASGNLGLNGDSGGAGYSKPYEKLLIQWSADVTKATATTGYCEVYVNGALYVPSQRVAAYAGGEESIGGVLFISNTVTGVQSVQIQCASADTNTLTINRASLYVQEVY